MSAPSQKLLTVETFGHFVLPLIKSYKDDGDFPPFRQVSHTLMPFSRHISFILLIIASLVFILPHRGISYRYSTIQYRKRTIFLLVEFHDIDNLVIIIYVIFTEFHEIIREYMVACFIGHRTITVTNELCERIRTTVLDLIDHQSVDTFLFGSRSQFDELCLKIVTEIKEIRQFDELCLKIVTEIKEIRPHIRRIYVRAEYPYISADYEKYLLTFYDETYMPENIIHAGKAIYIERNRHMIDSSDICIFYFSSAPPFPLNYTSGTKRIYSTIISNHKRYINLCDS